MTPGRCLALALLLLLTASGCQSTEAKLEEHMRRGTALVEEGSYAEAIIEFRSAVALQPNHAQAHYALARANIAEGNLERGYWELRETVRLSPENVEARYQLAELTSLGGELEDALHQVDELLFTEGIDDELRLSTQMLRAQILDMQKKPVEALAAYEKAIELDPDSFDANLLLAGYHQRRGNAELAEPLFRKLIEINEGFEAYLSLASFLARDRDREDEAEATYRLALTHASLEAGERLRGLRSLASFFYSRGRNDDAESTLVTAHEESPEDLDLIYLLARFYLIRGEKEKADAMIELATEARPDEVEPYLVLARYRFRTGDRESALEALDIALKLDPESDLVRLERAERIVELGVHKGPRERIAEARGVVESVLAKDGSPSEALVLKGKLDLLEGRHEAAIVTLRQAARIKQDWAPLHFLLGSALFVDGSFPEAREELARTLEIDATMVEARHMLARVYAALGKHDLAIEEGRRVLTRRADRDILILVAQSLASQRKVNEALRELSRVIPERRDAEVHYAYGRLYVAKGDNIQARASFEAALALQPNSSGVLERMLELDRREGRLTDSIGRIEAALEKDPDSSQLTHLRGLAALAAGHGEGAESYFRRATELDEANVRAFSSLARLLQGTRRGAEAILTYEQALESQPRSASLHLIVATLREMRGDTERAIHHYEEAVRLSPTLVSAKNDLANLLAEEEMDLDRALALAQEARAMLPSHPNTADTLGWVLYKRGMPSAAVGYLQEAENLGVDDPDVGTIRYHLALAYEASDRPRDALATIKRALDDLDATDTRLADASEDIEPDWAANMRKMRFRLRGSHMPLRRLGVN